MNMIELPDEFVGYPGIEDYSSELMENLQTFVRIAFRLYNLSWEHPRVQQFLVACADRIGWKTPFTKHTLPFFFYRLLATHLAQQVTQDRLLPKGRDLILAEAMLRDQTKLLGAAQSTTTT